MDAEAAYDAVPYVSKPFPASHPDRLHVVGRLLGLDPAPVATARVLELGCAAGGNLIPIAARLPGTTCVGVDISGVQIADGQDRAAALGLTNCTLLKRDISALEPLGTFDYVIVHGVWSWVPEPVQDAILAVIGGCLAPHGLATVSYNTFPGWFRRGMVREMCRWHTADLDSEAERVDQARTLVAFLLSALEGSDSHHAEAIRQEARLLQQTDSTYLTHGLLAPINTPCWYHELAARVEDAGLAVVGDASPAVLLHDGLPQKARLALARLPEGSVRREQLADLLGNGTFRRSVIARADAAPQRPVRWTAVCDTHVSTLARRAPGVPGTFALFRGGAFGVRNPLVAGALGVLVDQRPATLPFDVLLERARAAVGLAASPEHGAVLAQSLLSLWSRGAVKLFPRALGIAATPSARPVACPVIREHARRDLGVPNLRHEHFVLKTMDRHLVQLLDGTADATALVDRLEGLHAAGTLTVEDDGRPIASPAAFRAACRQGIGDWVGSMASAGFLVA